MVYTWHPLAVVSTRQGVKSSLGLCCNVTNPTAFITKSFAQKPASDGITLGVYEDVIKNHWVEGRDYVSNTDDTLGLILSSRPIHICVHVYTYIFMYIHAYAYTYNYIYPWLPKVNSINYKREHYLSLFLLNDSQRQ